MAEPRKDQDKPKAEADRQRDELARRILSTPHKPREESKVGKPKPAKKPSTSTKAKKRS